MAVVLNTQITLDPNNQIAHIADTTSLVDDTEYLISGTFLQADTRFTFYGNIDIALTRPPLGVPASQTEVAATISTVPTPAAVIPPARYPYTLNDRLLAGNLNLAFEMDPAPTPPAGNGGGARQYRYWIDTTGNDFLRQCMVPVATPGVFVPSEWMAWGGYDIPARKFYFDGLSIGFYNGLSVAGPLSVTGNAVITGTLAVSGTTNLPFVKLAGDTMTGSLTVNAGVSVSGDLSVSGNIGTLGTVYCNYLTATLDVTGRDLIANRNVWAGNGSVTAASISATGAIAAGGALTGAALSIAGSGTINGTLTAGNISATSTIYASGTITSGTTITAGNQLVSNNSITAVGNITSASMNVTTLSAGTITAGSNITGNNIHANGHLTVDGNVGVDGEVAAATYYAAGDTNFKLGAETNYRVLRFYANAVLAFDTTTGSLLWNVPAGSHLILRASDGATLSTLGSVQGNGPYVNLSDRRFKQDDSIAPATQGLDVILQLTPVEFKRSEIIVDGVPIERPLELGFIAQDVRAALPEAVYIAGVELPDGSGGLSASDPTLGLASETIVAVLVNAVKELERRIATLEARPGAPA